MRKLGIITFKVILCDEWTPQQVKPFRLNRSMTSARMGRRALSPRSLEVTGIGQVGLRHDSTGFDSARSTLYWRFPTRNKQLPSRHYKGSRFNVNSQKFHEPSSPRTERAPLPDEAIPALIRTQAKMQSIGSHTGAA